MSIADQMDRKDRPAYVTFHHFLKEDKAASLKAGHYVAKDVHMAHVTPAYTKDIIKFDVKFWFENMKQEVANGRTPQSWVDAYMAQYEAWKRGEELPPVGTAIKGWGVIGPEVQETLVRMNIRTVEDLALVNADGMARIGMNAVELKNKAQAWLAQLQDKGPLTLEMAALKSENAQLKASLENLSKQLQAVADRVGEPVYRAEEVTESISVADLTDDGPTLEQQYTAKFGKAPHHRMKPETIEAAVRG